MIHYNDKRFRAIENSPNGEVSGDMTFHYKQEGDQLVCQYFGGKILEGWLEGIVNKEGIIEMNYTQVNIEGKQNTGNCTSTPEILPNGKIRLNEDWQWTSGDQSKGTSILEEI
jgi:hypothetical protein